MTIEEIRKGAPNGSTGYIIHNNDVIYVKNEMIWHRGSWWFATFTNKDKIKPL